MMKLQKERKVNPVAGCLPMVLQAPVFIALLHVLRRLGPGAQGLYSWSDELTHQASVAQVFGAPISSNFLVKGPKLDELINITGTTAFNIKVVTGVLILVMCTTQFLSTRQIMKRSGPTAGGQMQMVQKLMLYGAPLGLLVSGTFFPLGVLVYWFTNNSWTIGQQFWVLKRMPPPNAVGKTGDGKTAIDPSKLAPRPGAKPVRRTTAVIDAESTAVDESVETVQPAEPASPTGKNATGKDTTAKNAVSGKNAAGKNSKKRTNGTPAGGAAARGDGASSRSGSNNTPAGKNGSPANGSPRGAGTAPKAGAKSAGSKPKPGSKPPQRRKKR